METATKCRLCGKPIKTTDDLIWEYRSAGVRNAVHDSCFENMVSRKQSEKFHHDYEGKIVRKLPTTNERGVVKMEIPADMTTGEKVEVDFERGQAMREMTLQEYVEQLPVTHRAREEYDHLLKNWEDGE